MCGCLAVSDVLCADVWLSSMSCVRLLSQLGGNKDHSTKICESCLTCMLVAVRSECEFVRKFPLKYSLGHFGAKEPGKSIRVLF